MPFTEIFNDLCLVQHKENQMTGSTRLPTHWRGLCNRVSVQHSNTQMLMKPAICLSPDMTHLGENSSAGTEALV